MKNHEKHLIELFNSTPELNDIPEEQRYILARDIAIQMEAQPGLQGVPSHVITSSFTPVIQIVAASQQSSISHVAQYFVKLVTNIITEDPRSTIPDQYAIQGHCPYPGLSYFAYEQSAQYFGREYDIDTCIELIDRPVFAITGPSGIGKSSLIHAGLWPRLVNDYPNSIIRSFRVTAGSGILSSFSLFLGDLLDTPSEDVLKSLRESKEALLDDLLMLKKDKQRVVLMLDQFEDIFVEEGEEGNRKDFLALLDNVVHVYTHGRNTSISLVLISRDNFFGHQDYQDRPSLIDIFQHKNILLRRLDRENLSRIINLPLNKSFLILNIKIVFFIEIIEW